MRANLFVRIFALFVLACGVYAVAQDSPMTNITGGGTKGTVPVFTATHKIGNSSITTDTSGDVTLGQNLTVNENAKAAGWIYSSNYLETAGEVYAGSYVFGTSYLESPYVYGTTEGQFGTISSGEGVFYDATGGPGIYAETDYNCNYCYPVGGQTLYSGGTSNEYAFFDLNGNLVEAGDSLGDTYAAGSKSAMVPLKNGKMVDVYSQESPQVWFEDFGIAHLVGGVATVKLESKFAQLVNTKLPYHVFLTPDGDCPGLYVAQKDRNSFEVRELGGGQSNVEFDYRISALRNGYEKLRLGPAPALKAPKVPQRLQPPQPPAPTR
jgi:hypothetical protein